MLDLRAHIGSRVNSNWFHSQTLGEGHNALCIQHQILSKTSILHQIRALYEPSWNPRRAPEFCPRLSSPNDSDFWVNAVQLTTRLFFIISLVILSLTLSSQLGSLSFFLHRKRHLHFLWCVFALLEPSLIQLHYTWTNIQMHKNWPRQAWSPKETSNLHPFAYTQNN